MDDNFDLDKLREPKRSRINSRTKGNSFERKIAKMLNENFSTDEFNRSPGSGAFATTHKLPDHLKLFGDLITPKEFRFCIECKKGYNKENLYSLYNYSSNFWGFINQCEKDSGCCNKLPLIIYQQDRQKPLAITRKDTFPHDIQHVLLTNEDGQAYSMCLLEDILELERQWFFN